VVHREWRRHVIAGAEQAFDTRIPDVTHGGALGDIVAKLPPAATRLALDNYEAALSLGDWPLPAEQPVVLALGAERAGPPPSGNCCARAASVSRTSARVCFAPNRGGREPGNYRSRLGL